ncbi:TATA-box-binding protein [Candidatus Micrarchaeota archaeon]|nr:TATA-box-binding protein [Candidatus Micrarchaeota archaeon]
MASRKRVRIKPVYKIENIVASGDLDLDLDLYVLAYKLRDIEYEPEQFPGAILKLKQPKASLLLFKNGKVICTGTKTEKLISKALRETYKMVSKYSKGPVKKVYRPKFTVENIVASGSLGVKLDLYKLAIKFNEIEYEPEQFPGAILKLKQPKASLLLFKNGKVICTGTKTEKDIKKALRVTAKMLEPYAKPLDE